MIGIKEYMDKYTEASLEEIKKTTMRSSFSNNQLQQFMDLKKRDVGTPREVLFHPLMENKTREFLEDGLMMFSLSYINISMLYVKIHAGKGFFGEKNTYNIYFDDTNTGESWTPGPVFKSYLLAITGLNNIFRAEGL